MPHPTGRSGPSAQTRWTYASSSVCFGLITIGFFLNWGLPVYVGFVCGLIWLYRISSHYPKVRLVLVTLGVTLGALLFIALVTQIIRDIVRFT